MQANKNLGEELAAKFEQAAAIAARLPENLQEAAFQRALDALGLATSANSTTGTPTSVRQAAIDTGAVESKDPVVAFNDLARERGPEIDAESGSLGQSLAVLLVARRELGIDGLTAAQIATILTDKFRYRYSRQAIIQALDKAGRLVDRKSPGKGAALYRLMQAGEDWLTSDPNQRSAPNGSSVARSRQKPISRKTKTSSAGASDEPATPVADSTKTSKKARRPARQAAPLRGHAGRQGPKAAVEGLIASGYFKTGRSISDIRSHLATNLARTYSATDLSPTMVRLLREQKLVRVKNEAGNYEYSAS